MKGKHSIIGSDLLKGTSKSAEGHAASIAFHNSFQDGMNVEVHGQDEESTSYNFFCCLLQTGNSPKAFSLVMEDLGTHHARDEHSWDGGQCSFHNLQLCACGKCKDKVLCKSYQTKFPLTCNFHSLAFEIECDRLASQAEDLIHPVLGRGHSNIPEASHSVLIRYRCKSIYLARLHYILSTNLGLLQSNLTYMYHKRGVGYHWLSDLFRRLKLPVLSGMEKLLTIGNEKRIKKLNKQKLHFQRKNVYGTKHNVP